MKKGILITVALIILASAAYMAWDKRYEYFFKGILEVNEETPGQTNNPDTNSGEEENIDSTGEKPPVNRSATVSDYDCDQRCEHRKNTSTYEYCRELCGLNEATEEETPVPADCSALKDLEKDICFKRKAVKEKKDDLCENIEDQQLKENCLNRVVEEILE